MIDIDLRKGETEQDRMNMVAAAMENWATRLRAGEKGLLLKFTIAQEKIDETKIAFPKHITTLTFGESLTDGMGGINILPTVTEAQFFKWLFTGVIEEEKSE